MRAESGVADGLPKADAIYVSAAASHPLRAWLEALKTGRTPAVSAAGGEFDGAMLLVTRPDERSGAWPAKVFSRVVFIACEGAQDGEIGRNSTKRSGAAARNGCAG